MRQFVWIPLIAWAIAAPALADPASDTAAPTTPHGPGAMAVETLAAGLTSAAVLGLSYLGILRLSALGGAGQIALFAGVALVPPLTATLAGERRLSSDDYFAALAGGIAGLGVGYLATGGVGGTTPGANDLEIKFGAMALGQGLGAMAGYELYRDYKPHATDLNRLGPEKIDEIKDWDTEIQRQRR
ncbi:MAG TPA: hypothetical protein V6D47_09780 [Oscillatoriaceae cyanobacterium]